MTTTKKSFVRKNFPVLHVRCAGGAACVENKIKSLEGVKSAAVNFANATVTLEYQPEKIDAAAIQQAVQSIGYDLMIGEDFRQDTLDKIHQQKYNSLKKKTFWSLLLALPVVVIGMFFMHMPYVNLIMWVFTTPVVFWLGRDFFINAWKQIKHRSANMDTLVALSIGTAYVFSLFNMLFPEFWQRKGLEAHVYFESAAVIVAFILLGRLLEEKAKGSTSSALKKLMGLQPKTVTVVKNNEEQAEVPIEDLMVGDLVLVKPGEKIAVDGTLISGDSFVNESMLSGEPMAVRKIVGEKVFAGTINQKGSFRFRADKVGKETMLAQIIQRVQDAQGSKAPVQKLVDKIAGIFVPMVVGIAVVTFFIWLFLGGENAFTHALLAFVTVLVIACPCALGLATPTAIMVGVGKGAEKGILIKDAESLELSQKVNAVVLDKTGTITEGKPCVTDELWLDESVKPVLASLEYQSEHPLAEAIVEHFARKHTITVSCFRSITGKGISGVAGGETYFAGNRKLLTENNIVLPEELAEKADEWSQSTKTVIWFSDSRNALAVLAVSDKIKETSVAAISQMRQMGIELYMLTGDNESTARAMAQQAGIEHYRAEMLPCDKSEFVKRLQKQGKVVAMVGDGINDSTALAEADVSIAMGKGSDIAMDVAKMTIISSDLIKIPQAIRLSRQTVRTIRQNLLWAFIYNIIGIPIAAGILYPVIGFLLNPMIAAAAMALSSVSVVSNSLRLKWKK